MEIAFNNTDTIIYNFKTVDYLECLGMDKYQVPNNGKCIMLCHKATFI